MRSCGVPDSALRQGHLTCLGVVGADGRIDVIDHRAVGEPRLWLQGYGNWRCCVRNVDSCRPHGPGTGAPDQGSPQGVGITFRSEEALLQLATYRTARMAANQNPAHNVSDPTKIAARTAP
jgi:hypothetical protein